MLHIPSDKYDFMGSFWPKHLDADDLLENKIKYKPIQNTTSFRKHVSVLLLKDLFTAE